MDHSIREMLKEVRQGNFSERDLRDTSVRTIPTFLKIEIGGSSNPERDCLSSLREGPIPITCSPDIRRAVQQNHFFYTGKPKEEELVKISLAMMGFLRNRRRRTFRQFLRTAECLGFAECYEETPLRILQQHSKLNTSGETIPVAMPPIPGSGQHLIGFESGPRRKRLVSIPVPSETKISSDTIFVLRRL